MSDVYPPYVPEISEEAPKKKNLLLIIIALIVFLCLGCLVFIALFYFVLGDMILEALGLVAVPWLSLV